jgi:glycerophosphoryl diester phosphodiesterase
MPAAKRAPSNRPLLLGHRGARARKSIPENTFDSFDQALADGCDGFEFDVRLTADGQGIVCHDARIGRIDIAKAAARECAGLLRLEDVLTRYHRRAFLDIELKVAGLEKITIAALRKHPPRQGVVVSSFLPEVLTALHNEGADIPLGLICETREQVLPWKQLPVTYVIPHQKLVRQELIREVNEVGKKMLVWTVNSRAQMERLSGWGVDGIISDDTKLLARTMK